jgi:flagellar hook assembly protein FlgD
MATNVSSVGTDNYYVPKAPEKKSDLSMETFMRLLTVQLANQNPLEPMTDRDFFAQIAQLGQVQGIDKLTDQGKVTQAQSLIGETIVAVRPNFATDATKSQLITGVVTKMNIVNGVHNLTIQEPDGTVTDVSVDSIQQILPNQKATDYAYLIGKQIVGANGNVSVAGKATGVSNSAGKLYVELLTSGGQKLSVPVDGISYIGE